MWFSEFELTVSLCQLARKIRQMTHSLKSKKILALELKTFPVCEIGNGISLLKLFWPTARNCSCDREKLMKFEAEGHEFAKILRSLEQFIQTVQWKNVTIFKQNAILTCS